MVSRGTIGNGENGDLPAARNQFRHTQFTASVCGERISACSGLSHRLIVLSTFSTRYSTKRTLRVSPRSVDRRDGVESVKHAAVDRGGGAESRERRCGGWCRQSA